MISKIHSAGAFITDADKAVDFYAKKLGLEIRADQRNDDGAWLEFAPAGSQTVLAITNMNPMGEEVGGFTGIVLQTPDLDNTYADLKAKGVQFMHEPQREYWGYYTTFADPDGNTYLLTEEPSA